MYFYQATSFLFPRNFEWRVLFICFLAVHVPLIACVALQAVTGHWELTTLATLLVATLAGTALGLAAIRALLAPVAAATQMLLAVQNGERLGPVPQGGEDLVGRLLAGVSSAADESATRIESLVEAAQRDPLTGIRNRRGFIDSARELLKEGTGSALALIDIDHFKQINDRFGHEAGDDLLKALALRLEQGLRRSDIAARWGGEEFAVLLPATGMDEAHTVLERLRASVALDLQLGAPGRPVTFSCGLATLHGFDSFEEASRRADAALYRAKEEGRNRVAVAG